MLNVCFFFHFFFKLGCIYLRFLDAFLCSPAASDEHLGPRHRCAHLILCTAQLTLQVWLGSWGAGLGGGAWREEEPVALRNSVGKKMISQHLLISSYTYLSFGMF